MKAVLVKSPYEFKLAEVDIPEIDDTQALIKVMACGVCGTDLHIARSQAGNWMSFGHEISGVVVKIGSAVTNVKVGDKVMVESGSFCHTCDMCRNGHVDRCTAGYNGSQSKMKGYSEYMDVPGDSLVAFDGISFAQATLIEPLGVALDLLYTTDIKLNDDVLVMGLGAIGLMAIKLARAAGARNIYAAQPSNRSTAKIALAKEYGVTDIIYTNQTPLNQYPFPRGGVDKIMITAPPRAIPSALSVANVGAIIGFLGIEYGEGGMITFDANDFHFKKLQLCSSYAAPALWFPRALELIQSGVIDPSKLITKTFPLEDLPKTMIALRDHTISEIKMVMVNPD